MTSPYASDLTPPSPFPERAGERFETPPLSVPGRGWGRGNADHNEMRIEKQEMNDMPKSNIAVFGEYIEPDQGSIIGRLSLCFQSGSLNIDELWESSLLSASFLSTFWGKFFPEHGQDAEITREKMKDAVHYICSELLGNAVKFSYNSEYMIEICLYLHESELRFYVSNSINPDDVEKFQFFIQRIISEDTQVLFLEQMEKSAAEDSHESGIGYLTMINDYYVRLSWKFQNIKPETASVTTLARLSVIREH